VYQKGLLRMVYQKGLPMLPTSVTRNGRATFFVSVIPSYSVEWRIEAMSHSDGPRPCGALTIISAMS
jgi:hypothetical protein